MIRRLCLVLAFVGCSTLTTYAQVASGIEVQIVERGIYRAETVKKTDTPGTTGAINTVQNVRLITNTTSVVGHIGVRFGLRYIVQGPMSDVDVKLVINFPLAGLRNPQTQEVFFHSEYIIAVPTGVARYWEYQFEYEWEIVPGLWHFQFWHRDQKLGEQRFCVHEWIGPRSTLALPKECGFGLLGSEDTHAPAADVLRSQVSAKGPAHFTAPVNSHVQAELNLARRLS